MFNRLKRRVIILVMSISGIILIGLFTVLCVTSYADITKTGFEMLERFAVSDRPDDLFNGEISNRPREERLFSSSGMLKIKAGYDSEGKLTIRKENEIMFNIKDETLYDVTNTVLLKNSDRGYLRDYDLRYFKTGTSPSGEITVVFGKYGYEREYMLRLVIVSVISVVAGLVIVFLISFPVSKAFAAPMEKAWAQQQQFIADVSHELKTPLTVILANNNILMNHKDEKIGDKIQWLTSTRDEARQMKHLLDEMLYLARADARMLQSERCRLNLSDLVTETALQFDAVAYENQVNIETENVGEICVSGSADDLKRLVSILIDNAVKYAYPETTVKISVKRVKNKAVININDSGRIIPADEIPYLFNRFYRGDKSRSKAVQGFGLGLPIAKEIVDSHGGEIRCESSESSGTDFTVFLPVAD